MKDNHLHKFLFDGLPVRGALVRITDGWQEALRRRAVVGEFPAPVRGLLGEMVAAGLLMQSSIKFDGALILQLHGDGPLKLAVAEVQGGLAFRATANVIGAIAGSDDLRTMANPGGHGRCAITLDPKGRAAGTLPYQGVVPLYGDHGEPLSALQEVLEHYMLQSEQLDTRLVLAADDRVAAGLLLQRMPLSGEGNLGGADDEQHIGRNEDFNRIAMLGATLTREELLSLPPQQVLRRLFWEEPLRVFDPQPVAFACTCSAARVRGMLQGLGSVEIQSIIAEQGEVEVSCDFCGQQFRFDAVDAAKLFKPGHDQPPTSGTLH